MAGKFYAVAKGKIPGIYENWDECKKMVDGFSGAVYKSFRTKEEAVSFMEEHGAVHVSGVCSSKDNSSQVNAQQENISGNELIEKLPKNYAFVDGSYNAAKKRYGYGGFLIHDGKKEILQGSGEEEDLSSMRNVAGEIAGSMAAIKKAMELSLDELTIYYDYAGIELWATGAWKRNRPGTIAYYEFVQSIKGRITLHFVKVKGHSGVEGNEKADHLAKEAVGITV